MTSFISISLGIAHNLSLLPLMPREYAHTNVPDGMTNLLAVSGTGTLFEADPNTNIRLKHVSNGLHKTMMLVSADADQAVEWTRPSNFVLNLADPGAGLGGLGDGTSFEAAFADGAIHDVPNTEPNGNLVNLMQWADG